MLANGRDQRLRQCRLAAMTALSFQLDQETGIRGYIATGRRDFLEPYEKVSGKYAAEMTGLQRCLRDVNVPDLREHADRIGSLHALWMGVAAKLMRYSNQTMPEMSAGKRLVDGERLETALLFDRLGAELQRTDERRLVNFWRALGFSALSLLLAFALAATLFTYLRRTQYELSRERLITAVLQQAFTSKSDPPANIRFGSAYLSSTQGAAVGGDLFDLHALPDARNMVLVADVSGKGINAAVDTASIKYSARALAHVSAEPASIATALNEIYRREKAPQGSFVVLFLAILDSAALTLDYVNAGLSTAYLIRDRAVSALAPTGPAVGIVAQPSFASSRLDLHVGDMVVICTDGFTEARGLDGRLLGEPRLESWLREAGAGRSAQETVDTLIGRLLAFTGKRLGDDLALVSLVVEAASPAPPTAQV